jgi:hypothetical protein
VLWYKVEVKLSLCTPRRHIVEWIYIYQLTHNISRFGQLHEPAAVATRKGPSVPIKYDAGWGPQTKKKKALENILENSSPNQESNHASQVVQSGIGTYPDYKPDTKQLSGGASATSRRLDYAQVPYVCLLCSNTAWHSIICKGYLTSNAMLRGD